VQTAFIQPPMIIRLTRADGAARANLVGGLYRDQNRLVPLVAAPALILGIALFLAGHLNTELAAIIIAGTAAIVTALHREFFRMVLFSYRLPDLVFKADFFYCILLIGGVALATLTPYPAAVAALAMSFACLVGRYLLSRAMWRHEPWNRNAPAGMMREILHQGSFSAFGAGSHWLFNQGYTYLVVATLNVSSVAALAATRLPLAPVTLLSNGIGSFMQPTVSTWTHNFPASTVFRRLTLFAFAIAGAVCIYLLAMWLGRDWIFVKVLKKSFDDRDLLLLTWSLVALVTVFRDQFIHFLTMRGRFQLTSSVTFVSAIVSLTTSFTAIRYLGIIGAPLGILAGELLNVVGLIVFSLREARLRPDSASLAP
jgi:O-antigen/teichoic acid export membrane protein